MNSLLGGKTLKKRKKHNVPWKGWKNKSPNHSQRVKMCKKCGKKCFLGKHLSFPICNKNTCKINKKGIYSAYIRARQYSNKGRKYKNISSKAKILLIKMGAKR
jgi:hypothetical protein